MLGFYVSCHLKSNVLLMLLVSCCWTRLYILLTHLDLWHHTETIGEVN